MFLLGNVDDYCVKKTGFCHAPSDVPTLALHCLEYIRYIKTYSFDLLDFDSRIEQVPKFIISAVSSAGWRSICRPYSWPTLRCVNCSDQAMGLLYEKMKIS